MSGAEVREAVAKARGVVVVLDLAERRMEATSG